MKSISAVFVVFSLLLVANLSCATKDLGGYWKIMMEDQPMPEAIKGLIQDPRASASDVAGKDRFIRDFDIKPNVILYHTHVVPTKRKHKSYVKKDATGEQTIKKG